MMMGFSLRAKMAFLCALCDHDRDDDCDPIEVAFKGATRYGACPLCLHGAGKKQHDPVWQAKVDAWVEKKKKEKADDSAAL